MWKSLATIALGVWLMGVVAPASANPFERLKAETFRIAEFNPEVQENKFLPGKPRTRVGEKRAASRAKSAFPNAKILSVNYMQRKDSYRVKLLSSNGVVKYVFVDPNGEVFE